MSEDSIGSPDLSMSRISLALAPASDFCARAAASCVLRSPSCCTESVVLFGPTRRLDLARNASTLASASATFLRICSISPESQVPALRAWSCCGFLQPLQVAVGDGIGDAGGEFGIFREKIDDDDARFLHREHGQPVVIGFEHALFRRHRHRVSGDAEEAEQRLDQRDAAERRIELGQLVELELGDHLGGEVAGQNKLRLADHRFLIDDAAVDHVLVGVGAQEHVVAADHEDARLGLIFRRDHGHHGEGEQRHDDGRAQDRIALAPERRAEARQIEIGVDELAAH